MCRMNENRTNEATFKLNFKCTGNKSVEKKSDVKKDIKTHVLMQPTEWTRTLFNSCNLNMAH